MVIKKRKYFQFGTCCSHPSDGGLESYAFAIDPACIDHYARAVSEWTKENTVSFGLRDMTRRFRDCLGR